MAIRRVTGAVSPSELIFADANALGATYDGSGTTIERGETFTLPAGGTTAVSNGALRLEALKGDCTITNNGNSTLTNASGVDGTIVMRSGASDFPAFVRNSSMGSMSTPPREDFTGDVSGTVSGTIGSSANLNSATFPTKVTDRTYWYPLLSIDDNYNVNYTRVTTNMDQGTSYTNGVAPQGFTSVQGIKVWLLSLSGNPGQYHVDFKWDIASSGQNRSVHNKTVSGSGPNNVLGSSSGFGANTIRSIDLFNAANDGADFEDTIAANDHFGIAITGSNTSANWYATGVEITWRF